MRRLGDAEVDALLEELGYFRQGDGSLLTSGTATGPKGMWVGPLGSDEYFTVDEIRDFLCEANGLLEEEVTDALDRLGYL